MMRTITRLSSLTAHVVQRIAYLIARRFDLVEVKILSLGLVLGAFLGLYLAFLLFTDPRLYGTLSSTFILHLMGGRALGVATCLSAGLSIPYTIVYNLYIEVVIVLIAYGIVVLIMRNVIEPKLLKATVRQAEMTAQGQKTRIKRYGAIGLFVFVMFPFVMTGPLVGAIIGYLLHYRPINNFAIVFSGTLSSIVIYALVGNNLLGLLDRHVNLDQVQTWGGIVVALLIVVGVLYHVGTVKGILDRGSDR